MAFKCQKCFVCGDSIYVDEGVPGSDREAYCKDECDFFVKLPVDGGGVIRLPICDTCYSQTEEDSE